jgi:hypothetical protein
MVTLRKILPPQLYFYCCDTFLIKYVSEVGRARSHYSTDLMVVNPSSPLPFFQNLKKPIPSHPFLDFLRRGGRGTRQEIPSPRQQSCVADKQAIPTERFELHSSLKAQRC